MFSFDLRTLADLNGPERAFLSIYLGSEDDRASLDTRFREIRSFLSDQDTELDHFKQNIELAAPLLEESFTGTSRVIFVCWALDFAEAHDLPVRVDTRVRVDSSPYIRPLAELEDEHQHFAVLVADNDRARVYLAEASTMSEEGRVRGDIKNRVKKGGWSQKRYARRREKELERYATDVSAQLEELHSETPFERLVILGQPEAMTAITEALGTAMRERVVAAESIDVGADDEADAAYALYFRQEREDERALWDEIREAGLSSRLGTTGPTRVLDAVRTGRAEAILVARDAKITGTRCRACEHLAHGAPDTCYVCGSGDLFKVDLVNELAELAAQTSATIDFADSFEALEDVGGVAALLRY